ncbi:hypothetical protein TNCV_2314351 [Trichonephila clavipes]|nr:hypothetical protein TNCV_2314351 [Trichonephila clavipes]
MKIQAFTLSCLRVRQILTEDYKDETLSRPQVFEAHNLFSGGKVSVEEDETAGRPWSAITDQSTVKIRDMSGFLLTSVVRLSISTSTLKYQKDFTKKLGIKRPELESDSWQLHQANAPAHTATSVKRFLTSKNITVMEHPLYSPDSASCDFFLSPYLLFL